MSRMTIALLLSAAPAGAAGGTAEQATANYRNVFKPIAELDCPRGVEEIIVCGTRLEEMSRYRVPYQPEPGARVRGEPSGSAAMSAGGCLRLCHQPATVNILAIPGAIKGAIDRLTERE